MFESHEWKCFEDNTLSKNSEAEEKFLQGLNKNLDDVRGRVINDGN